MRTWLSLAAMILFVVPGLVASGAPTTKPAAPLRVAPLPAGWEASPVEGALSVQAAHHAEGDIEFLMTAQPKSDFKDKLDLMGWAKDIKAAATKSSKQANRKETALKGNFVGGRTVVGYEITGDFDNVPLRYRIIMLEAGEWFYKMIFATQPSHWDAAQPKIVEMVNNFGLAAAGGTTRRAANDPASFLSVRFVGSGGKGGNELTFALTNVSGKSIAWIDGSLIVHDRSSKDTAGLGVTHKALVKPGETFEFKQRGGLDDPILKQLVTNPNGMKLEFDAFRVVYPDGTKIEL